MKKFHYEIQLSKDWCFEIDLKKRWGLGFLVAPAAIHFRVWRLGSELQAFCEGDHCGRGGVVVEGSVDGAVWGEGACAECACVVDRARVVEVECDEEVKDE